MSLCIVCIVLTKIPFKYTRVKTRYYLSEKLKNHTYHTFLGVNLMYGMYGLKKNGVQNG